MQTKMGKMWQTGLWKLCWREPEDKASPSSWYVGWTRHPIPSCTPKYNPAAGYEQSILNYKPEIKAKKKRQRPWTEQIHQAVKKCWHTWWEWRKAGSPVDHADPYVCQMKEAKRSLRKEQRRESAKIRTQKIENIMNTEKDSRTFFKLIKDQRISSNTQTETLIVENQICDTDQKYPRDGRNTFRLWLHLCRMKISMRSIKNW